MDDATYSLDPFIQISFEELLSKALLLFLVGAENLVLHSWDNI